MLAQSPNYFDQVANALSALDFYPQHSILQNCIPWHSMDLERAKPFVPSQSRWLLC